MAGWSASTWMKVALVCQALALILFVIAFATVSWTTMSRTDGIYTAYDHGLWRYEWCTRNRCGDGKIDRALQVNPTWKGSIVILYKFQLFCRCTFRCIDIWFLPLKT